MMPNPLVKGRPASRSPLTSNARPVLGSLMHIRMITRLISSLAAFALSFCAYAMDSTTSANSNLWPIHRDDALGYQVSFPPGWKVIPGRGPNTRFSVVPPSPPGNCNLVVVLKPELASMDQASLNAEVQALGLERDDWASYVGVPVSKIRVSQTRRTCVNGVAAIIGVLETDLENLQGQFMRKQTVALMLHRGSIWTLNCGATDFNSVNVRARYEALSPVLSKIVGSFSFIAAAVTISAAQAESLTPAQIKQIEQIAQKIAAQHNANASAMIDDTTTSSTARAVGRNVRIENILRVKKGLPPAKLKEFSDATQGEVVPQACAVNAKNPAFDRGLTYTFIYTNTYGEKLAEFTVDKAACRAFR